MFLLIFLFGFTLAGLTDYDMGVMENEPLLRTLCEENLNFMKSFKEINEKYPVTEIEVFLKVTEESNKSVEEYVRHPLNSFNLLKKAAVFIPALSNTLSSLKTENSTEMLKLLEILFQETEVLKTITEKDMYGAAKALIFIVHAYDLDTEKFRKGLVDTTDVKYYAHGAKHQGDSALTSQDLKVLATMSQKLGLINTGIKFMRSAYKAQEESEDTEQIDVGVKDQFEKAKQDLIKLNNDFVTNKKTFINDLVVVNKYLVDEKLEKKKTQPKFIKSGAIDKVDISLATSFGGDFFHMEALLQGCRNEFNLLPSKIKWPLISKCRLLHQDDPYLKLGPFKMEVASNTPFIMVVHELLTDEDTEYLVNWATPKLSRSRNLDYSKGAYDKDSFKGKVRNIVKSVQAWMEAVSYHEPGDMYNPDNFTVNHPRVHKLSARMELAFNLNLTRQWSSNLYQVTNYGLGGLCESHMDAQSFFENLSSNPETLVNRGDYVATIMAWLTDTPAGGGTSFFQPPSSVTVHPTKGSAAFWWDLTHQNLRDQGTKHGGCPVAVGSKWILNKWVYSYNQWDKVPCRLEKGNTNINIYRVADTLGPFSDNKMF